MNNYVGMLSLLVVFKIFQLPTYKAIMHLNLH